MWRRVCGYLQYSVELYLKGSVEVNASRISDTIYCFTLCDIILVMADRHGHIGRLLWRVYFVFLREFSLCERKISCPSIVCLTLTLVPDSFISVLFTARIHTFAQYAYRFKLRTAKSNYYPCILRIFASLVGCLSIFLNTMRHPCPRWFFKFIYSSLPCRLPDLWSIFGIFQNHSIC